MAVRWREAGGGTGPGGAGNAPGATESPYAKLERALREVYEAARVSRAPVEPASVELGGLVARVYTKIYSYWSYSYAVIFEVYSRGDGGDQPPLCYVRLEFKHEEPYAFEVDCLRLSDLASRCARGEGCVLSWEEARTALRLAVWAVSRLAGLAGVSVKVEGAGLVEARDTLDGGPRVFPCLQVSASGKSYSVCERAHLSRDSGGRWSAESIYRLVPIGKHARMAVALAELGRMVSEYTWNQESKGAERIHAGKHQGEFLELKEFVLRRPDGTEEVLLEPWLPGLYHIGEGLAVVFCPDSYMESSDSDLADAVRKELDEIVEVVVRACRHYRETGDPRLTTFAYITVEALRRAGLA